MYSCLPSGAALHAAGVGGGGDGDLQDLSGVLEPLGSRALQRESVLHLQHPPTVRRAPPQTPLPARALTGTPRYTQISRHDELPQLFTNLD